LLWNSSCDWWGWAIWVFNPIEYFTLEVYNDFQNSSASLHKKIEALHRIHNQKGTVNSICFWLFTSLLNIAQTRLIHPQFVTRLRSFINCESLTAFIW
jgi:hypothetical protein